MEAVSNVLDIPTGISLMISKQEEANNLIDLIDLSMIKIKLMDEEEGQGWDEEFTAFAETRYKRYLCLQYLYPQKSIVPTKDIDLFWHQHILDTRAYARDCQTIFGRFLHHFPYFGMRGDDDAKKLLDSFEETKILYASHFLEDLCLNYSDINPSSCHKGTSTCHKCEDAGGCTDTIKCTRCS
jgi:hypothetical protein